MKCKRHSWKFISVSSIRWCKRCGCYKFNGRIYTPSNCKKSKRIERELTKTIVQVKRVLENL